MSHRIIADKERAARFHQEIMGGPMRRDCTGLVLERDGEIVASVIYESYNGANIFPHIASRGARWLTRDFLREMFHYPFVQLGCQRLTGIVDCSNWKSRRFNAHLGFTPEAILKRAGGDGGDAILYVMFREDCRYVAPPGN